MCCSLVNEREAYYLYLLSCHIPGAVVLTSGFETGSGPIFLDQLMCSGTEESLLECSMGRAVGLHQCNHSMDVGLTCSGT